MSGPAPSARTRVAAGVSEIAIVPSSELGGRELRSRPRGQLARERPEPGHGAVELRQLDRLVDRVRVLLAPDAEPDRRDAERTGGEAPVRTEPIGPEPRVDPGVTD